MLDIQYIRDNPDKVKTGSKNKGININVDKLLELDNIRHKLLVQIEDLRKTRNSLNDSAKGQRPSEKDIEKGKKLKHQLAVLDKQFTEADEKFAKALREVPNMPLDSVPIGKSEDDNVVARIVGEPTKFDFEPKSHWELAEARDWIDKERATKIAGARFVYLKGDLVRLEFALMQYGMDVLGDEKILQAIIDSAGLKGVSPKPFTPVLPPAVAKTEVFKATGRLNKEEQTYKLEGEDLWLNASAEHTLSPMYMDEILDEKEMPIRLVGFTTAFRREAGTYGKDTEGILRLHQFNKLEMESFSLPNGSLEEHLFMVAIQEYLMQQLELPYRVLEKCTADIGSPNAKGVDIEVWLPGQDKYRETHTADYITDYQARPMKTRVRRIDGSVELVHTNDATVFSERPLAAIIENYQTKDGKVKVPEVLVPYMGGRSEL